MIHGSGQVDLARDLVVHPTNGPGQHEALGRYLRAVLDSRPRTRQHESSTACGALATRTATEAKPVDAAATEKAEQVTQTLFDALARGISP